MIPLVVISGPTASGKSGLAIRLARWSISRGCPAAVVNADSMNIYRGMDIGTAKPTLAEREGVDHYLFDILDITERATVAEFQPMARDTIARLRSAGTMPIMVGGSSLYVRAIVDDFDFPGTDPAIRAKYEERLAQIGSHALHAELASRAPHAAQEILPGNGRRIVRALEILELTGEIRPNLPGHEYVLENVHQFGLSLDRSEMDQRIAARVEQMWDAGFVDEVRELVQHGLRQGLTASRGLGYQQILSFLDGEISEEQAKADTITATRKFSRKQLSWYRRDPRITWLNSADDNVDRIWRALWPAGLPESVSDDA